jgi:hypothetical protein
MKAQNTALSTQLVTQKRSTQIEEKQVVQEIQLARKECEAMAGKIEIEKIRNNELKDLLSQY